MTKADVASSQNIVVFSSLISMTSFCPAIGEARDEILAEAGRIKADKPETFAGLGRRQYREDHVQNQVSRDEGANETVGVL